MLRTLDESFNEQFSHSFWGETLCSSHGWCKMKRKDCKMLFKMYVHVTSVGILSIMATPRNSHDRKNQEPPKHWEIVISNNQELLHNIIIIWKVLMKRSVFFFQFYKYFQHKRFFFSAPLESLKEIKFSKGGELLWSKNGVDLCTIFLKVDLKDFISWENLFFWRKHGNYLFLSFTDSLYVLYEINEIN